jgi:hypothetical protein
VPAPQVLHAAVPVDAWPAVHAMQRLAAVLPLALAWYVPRAQFMQTPAVEYVPAPQSPAQWAAVTEDPASLFFPAAQLMQLVWLAVGWVVPAAHAMHVW